MVRRDIINVLHLYIINKEIVKRKIVGVDKTDISTTSKKLSENMVKMIELDLFYNSQ